MKDMFCCSFLIYGCGVRAVVWFSRAIRNRGQICGLVSGLFLSDGSLCLASATPNVVRWHNDTRGSDKAGQLTCITLIPAVGTHINHILLQYEHLGSVPGQGICRFAKGWQRFLDGSLAALPCFPHCGLFRPICNLVALTNVCLVVLVW